MEPPICPGAGWSSVKTLAAPIGALCGPAGVVIAGHRCGAGDGVAVVVRAGNALITS
jgi:hypothetical protein